MRFRSIIILAQREEGVCRFSVIISVLLSALVSKGLKGLPEEECVPYHHNGPTQVEKSLYLFIKVRPLYYFKR